MARNILQMALPMTVAQLINILYNIVDRMYLGRLPGHYPDRAGAVPAIISILMALPTCAALAARPVFHLPGQGGPEEAGAGDGQRIYSSADLRRGGDRPVLIFKRPILYLFGASDATYPYADAI